MINYSIGYGFSRSLSNLYNFDDIATYVKMKDKYVGLPLLEIRNCLSTHFSISLSHDGRDLTWPSHCSWACNYGS